MPEVGVHALPILLLALGGGVARAQATGGKPEILEKVDPYTRGDTAALGKAGYVAFAPFEWDAGVRTGEVEETLGAGTVLWVETGHFKIGSTLESYALHADTREEKALAAELSRLRPKLARYQTPRNRIDPWMRLHLYAQRLEEAHAAFAGRFGFTPAESAGMPKPRVLLLERTSSLGRYAKRYLDREPRSWDRTTLPGGAPLLCVSAEGVRTDGFELDAGLHCVVASAITRSLVDGFGGSPFTCPIWLEYGLAHVAAREVDERFTPTAVAKGRVVDEDDWKWEERVRGLVQNKADQSWPEMLAWEKWEDMQAQSHLVAWSRVAWLLEQKPAELKVFLSRIVKPPADRDPEDRSRVSKEQQIEAAQAAFGKSYEELDRLWKKSVLRG